MAYVAPTTKAAGQKITAVIWNQDVKDNVIALANRPACEAVHSTTQSLTDNVEATVAFDTDASDNDAMHDPVTLNTRITFKTAGFYVVSFGCEITAAADYASYYCYIRLNGTTLVAQGSSTPPLIGSVGLWLTATALRKFNLNDYVEVRILQNNTTSAARNIFAFPHFAAAMLSLG